MGEWIIPYSGNRISTIYETQSLLYYVGTAIEDEMFEKPSIVGYAPSLIWVIKNTIEKKPEAE